jgi:KUP system potassium uptake protein
LPKSMVIMAAEPIEKLDQQIPPLQQMFCDRYGLLPKHLIFLHVKIEKVPYIKKNRFEIVKFYDNKKNGSIASVRVRFGFMEDTNVEKILINLAKHKEINIDEHPKKWLIHIRQENVLAGENLKGFIKKVSFTVFSFLLKNSKGSDYYFGLGKDIRLSTEVLAAEIN